MGGGGDRFVASTWRSFHLYHSVWILVHSTVAAHECDFWSVVGLGDEPICYREPPQRRLRIADDDAAWSKDYCLQPVERPETLTEMASACNVISIFVSDFAHDIQRKLNLAARSNNPAMDIHSLRNDQHLL